MFWAVGIAEIAAIANHRHQTCQLRHYDIDERRQCHGTDRVIRNASGVYGHGLLVLALAGVECNDQFERNARGMGVESCSEADRHANFDMVNVAGNKSLLSTAAALNIEYLDEDAQCPTW